MHQKIVTLPMYDWPEVEAATNRFYRHLKQAFDDAGFNPPDELKRDGDLLETWKSPYLLLGQTCGMPFCTQLKGKVTLVGTPAYAINCDAGFYNSAIVVHKDAPFWALCDLKDKIFAYNSEHSQSGYAALMSELMLQPTPFNPLLNSIISGGHRQSIKAVADGNADFAAIDSVTWELALRHEPNAVDLRVLGVTKQTPGLPYITAHRPDAEVHSLQQAIGDTIKSLDGDTKNALLLTNFVVTSIDDYQVIEDQLQKIKSCM